MFLLAVLLSTNAVAGMVWPELSFHALVYADLAVKVLWGLYFSCLAARLLLNRS